MQSWRQRPKVTLGDLWSNMMTVHQNQRDVEPSETTANDNLFAPPKSPTAEESNDALLEHIARSPHDKRDDDAPANGPGRGSPRIEQRHASHGSPAVASSPRELSDNANLSPSPPATAVAVATATPRAVTTTIVAASSTMTEEDDLPSPSYYTDWTKAHTEYCLRHNTLCATLNQVLQADICVRNLPGVGDDAALLFPTATATTTTTTTAAQRDAQQHELARKLLQAFHHPAHDDGDEEHTFDLPQKSSWPRRAWLVTTTAVRDTIDWITSPGASDYDLNLGRQTVVRYDNDDAFSRVDLPRATALQTNAPVVCLPVVRECWEYLEMHVAQQAGIIPVDDEAAVRAHLERLPADRNHLDVVVKALPWDQLRFLLLHCVPETCLGLQVMERPQHPTVLVLGTVASGHSIDTRLTLYDMGIAKKACEATITRRQARIKDLVAQARTFKHNKQNQRAWQCLQKKKLLEADIEKNYDIIVNFERLEEEILNQHQNVSYVVPAWRSANASLAKFRERWGGSRSAVEKLREDLLENLQDVHDASEVLAESINVGGNVGDEDELLQELQGLMIADSDDSDAPTKVAPGATMTATTSPVMTQSSIIAPADASTTSPSPVLDDLPIAADDLPYAPDLAPVVMSNTAPLPPRHDTNAAASSKPTRPFWQQWGSGSSAPATKMTPFTGSKKPTNRVAAFEAEEARVRAEAL